MRRSMVKFVKCTAYRLFILVSLTSVYLYWRVVFIMNFLIIYVSWA